jgi:hypothetical protein
MWLEPIEASGPIELLEVQGSSGPSTQPVSGDPLSLRAVPH